jgi:hypothetical protein
MVHHEITRRGRARRFRRETIGPGKISVSDVEKKSPRLPLRGPAERSRIAHPQSAEVKAGCDIGCLLPERRSATGSDLKGAVFTFKPVDPNALGHQLG